jgi:tetratricopeptide (TPR) repeat protein
LRAEVVEEYAWELSNAHRFEGAVDAARRAVEIREGLDDPAALGQALVTLSRQLYVRADMDDAQATVDRAVALLDDGPDRARLALARTSRGVLLALRDREEEAVDELRPAHDLAAELGAHDLMALCLNYIGLARLYLGDDGGLELLRRSIAEAAAVQHREYLARAYTSVVKGLAPDRALRRPGALRRGGPGPHPRVRLPRPRLHALGPPLPPAGDARRLACAERGLRALDAEVPDAGVLGRETLPVLARLLVRRGHDEAGAALDPAWGRAWRSNLLQALAPIAVASHRCGSWRAGRPICRRVTPGCGRSSAPSATSPRNGRSTT